jgi:predicted deacylase
MATIEIGTARARTGERVDGMLKVADLPDGQPMQIPVTIVQGSADGPVLWLHGCVHGNEYCGAYIIQAFLRGLDPAALRGTVVALPFLNLTASQRNQRMSPFEGYNVGDMNRCFPGKEDGGLTDQMGHAVWTHLKRHATHLVDFHTALTPDTHWSLVAGHEGKVRTEGLAMARAFGYSPCLPTPPGTLNGSAMMAAGAAGIPSLIIEAGGIGSAFSPETVKEGAERLRNVARRIGLLGEKVVDHGKLTLVSNFAWCKAAHGGLFKPAVRCGQPIKKGGVVGMFFNTHGEKVADERAPATGVVLAINPGPLLPQGDILIHIGLEPRLETRAGE